MNKRSNQLQNEAVAGHEGKNWASEAERRAGAALGGNHYEGAHEQRRRRVRTSPIWIIAGYAF